MASDFQFTRLKNGQKQRTSDLGQVIGTEKLKGETWLFVSPHDDDVCIGAGLWVQAAVKAGVNVQSLIVTDGRMGYCTLEQRDTIAEVRRQEAIESFQILGVPATCVHYIGYPDGGLAPYLGRRRANPGEPHIAGYMGLQNAFTYHLRSIRPTRVFVPTFTDLHPDHQITHNELMICLFHAGGDIWPELGAPLSAVPAVYEMAIYCDFAAPPSLEVTTSPSIFETKLKSIATYRSQRQIAALVENVRKGGAYEYLREVNFRFYSSANYRPMFA